MEFDTYCLLAMLWIITGLWPNAFSFGLALPATGLISWVALYCLYCLCVVNCTKFGKLILTKIIKIVATRCQDFTAKCSKFDLGWGSAPDPAGGAYSAPPDFIAGGEGAGCPSPKTQPAFGPSGLDTCIRPFGPQYSVVRYFVATGYNDCSPDLGELE